MKKLLTLTCAALSSMVIATESGENVIKNGDFEKITKIAKNNDTYILNKIVLDQCDLGAGPMASYPTDWLPGSGSIKVRFATNSEEDNTVAFAGNKSLILEAVGNGGHLIAASVAAKPGKYLLSFSWKGTGRLTVCTYLYDKDANGKTKFRSTRAIQSVAGKDKWQQFQKEFTLGEDADHFGFSLNITQDSKIFIDNISLQPVVETVSAQ